MISRMLLNTGFFDSRIRQNTQNPACPQESGSGGAVPEKEDGVGRGNKSLSCAIMRKSQKAQSRQVGPDLRMSKVD